MKTREVNVFFLIIIILLIMCSIFIAPIFSALKIPSYMGTVILEFGFLLVPSIIFMLIKKQPIKKTLRLNKINISSVLLIIIIGLLVQPIMMLLGTLAQLVFHNYVADAFKEMQSLSYPALIGIVALTPAICEETVMRGVIFSGYKNINLRKAALMNGFMFGLFHLNPQQFFYAFALGFIFVYLVDITNSIFASSICHFTVNGVQTTIAWISMKFAAQTAQKQTDITSLPTTTIIGMIIGLFILAAISTVLLVLVIIALKNMNQSSNYSREEIYSDDNRDKKVMTWPIYVSILLYGAFMGLLAILTRTKL